MIRGLPFPEKAEPREVFGLEAFSDAISKDAGRFTEARDPIEGAAEPRDRWNRRSSERPPRSTGPSEAAAAPPRGSVGHRSRKNEGGNPRAT